jgi:hypothetical protein
VSSAVAIFPDKTSGLIGRRDVQRSYPSPEFRGLKALGPDRSLEDVQQLALQGPMIPRRALTDRVGDIFRHILDRKRHNGSIIDP